MNQNHKFEVENADEGHNVSADEDGRCEAPGT
jgi:hypothetical protein